MPVTQLKDVTDANGDHLLRAGPDVGLRPLGRPRATSGTTTCTCPPRTPATPRGMSAYGRWMYGPWFWPPATGTEVRADRRTRTTTRACKLDVPSTWQYQTDPFCEPELIPGTPNISVGMEQFNDTPLVNGVGLPDGRPWTRSRTGCGC